MDSSSKKSNMSTTQERSCTEVDPDHAVATTQYYRWFVIQSVDSDNPINKLSPFVLDKAIRCTVGTVKSIKRFRKGDLLIEVSIAIQSHIVNKLNNLAGCPVTASPHRTLNTVKGVIKCAPLIDCNREEILSELASQGVTDIFNITVRDESGGRRNTNTFIVTFHLSTVPKHINIGYIRVPVTVYIPNPPRCFNCQKYGHGKNTCKERETCANCGQAGHNSKDCLNEAKCPNCAGRHSAFSRNCPKWVTEKTFKKSKLKGAFPLLIPVRL